MLVCGVLLMVIGIGSLIGLDIWPLIFIGIGTSFVLRAALGPE